MEILVGPTFSIEVSSPQDNHPRVDSAAPNCIFLKDEEDDEIGGLISTRIGPGIRINELDDNSTDSSSSIGAPDDSDEEGEEVDSGSSSSKGAIVSLDALEDSLPIKRGLSNHFAGKSKSFTNLSDVSSSVNTVKDLVKPENPFNKRRRTLMANKWYRRKSSFYSWSNPKSMPLLALAEEEEEEEEAQQLDHRRHHHHHLHHQEESESEEEEEDNEESSHPRRQLPKLSKLQDRKFRTSFKSHSCFSLTDLQEDEQYQ
ncbi:conserved hypothetical protein [Ricinus communis]|uniref:Uncharacterized protein n=1 Tax=Ricinus communis TaxID=3988 RepID=B9RNM6_RICCO|nr:conserved hypothetical protein [Ricinus communis]|eukprot:XP_002515345.1 SPARC-like protein 1 [Ricinus communis]